MAPPRLSVSCLGRCVRGAGLVLGLLTALTRFDAAVAANGGPAAADVRGAWHLIAATGSLPSARRELPSIYDPVGDRMILFGGLPFVDGTYALDFASGTWSQLSNVGSSPTPRADMAAVYDPVRRRMLMFGGSLQFGGASNDVWYLPLDGSGPWQILTTQGTRPVARNLTTMIYDPVRDQIVVFGGLTDSALNDTWTLNLSGTPTWTNVNPSNPPPARFGHVSVYDPVGDRMVVFGGLSLSDTWVLPLGSASPTWSQLAVSGGSPPPLYGATAVYDPIHATMIVCDGFNGGGSNDAAWELSLNVPQWTPLGGNPPSGTHPHARRFHTAVCRTSVNQMVIFGGYDDAAGYLNDTWEMELAPPTVPVITRFTPTAGAVGDTVTITGAFLSSVTSVQLHGVPADFSAPDDQTLITIVPVGATSGPFTASSPTGTGTSSGSFTVSMRPVVLSANPDSGRYGAAITIRGRVFTGATAVSFGGATHATFTVLDDSTIVGTVDHDAQTGPITVTGPVLSGTGGFVFKRLGPFSAAHLLPVLDVPLDQGGRVSVRWDASDYDNPIDHLITTYRVWRRSPVYMGHIPSPLPQAERAVPLATGATSTDYWESVAEIPAAFLQGYGYAAYTLSDSIAAGNPYTAFFIQALTSNPVVFYTSNIDSGYSVDNLAPSTPGSFAAVAMPGGVRLHWYANHETDLAHYRLYKGGSAGFVPDSTTLIAVVADTTYLDAKAGTYYKLEAEDIHGNLSGGALAIADRATATLAALVAVAVRDDGVHLTWQSSAGAAPWTLERSPDGTAWRTIATAVADADGRIELQDPTAEPGDRYEYRVRATIAGASYVTSPVAVSVPAIALAIASNGPNPTRGHDVVLKCALPSSVSAHLDVLDVSGRIVASRDLGEGAGHHDLQLAARDLRPGLHFARLTQDGMTVTTRFVVTR